MGLDKRLSKLEAALPPGRSWVDPIAEQQKREWLAWGSVRRDRDRDHDEWRVRDLIRLLHHQGRLPPSADGLRARLLAWRPPLDPGAVERSVARAIFDLEEGTENMLCPPEWRECFEAADELRELHAAVPAETHARWTLEAAADNAEGCAEAESFGLTEELYLKAAGPDAEELADDEFMRRLRMILVEDFYGERGYEISQHIDKLQRKET